jgi:PRTRC genetic system protein A
MTAQEKFREQVRSQQIGYYFGQPQEFTKPVSYVATTNGIFEVRQTKVGMFIAPAEKIPRVNFTSTLKPGVLLKHGRLPYVLLRQFINFAQQVLKLYDSEAYAEFRLNPETGEYMMLVPHQDVSGGQANVWKIEKRQAKQVKELPYLPVMQIHSHPTFWGRFSGKDDHDDRTCGDAMIFGVIGNIDSDNPTSEFRINVGGTYVPLELTDVFMNPMVDVQGNMDASFPEEWLQMVHAYERRQHVSQVPDHQLMLWDRPDALEPWDIKGPFADLNLADRILRILEETKDPNAARAMVGYLTIDLNETEMDGLSVMLEQSGMQPDAMLSLGLLNS